MSDLRREDGFTLPELLVTLVIAVTVSLATFALIEFVMKRAGEVDQRVDASQRGRLVMDTITRELRSQVCVDSTTPAMATRTGDITNGNTATFYVDLTDGSKLATTPPALHSLVYDPSTRKITEKEYRGTWFLQTTGTPPNQITKNVPAYPTAPDSTRVLLTDVVPLADGGPIFRYYKYNTLKPPSPSIELVPPVTGMTASDLATVARVDIAYRTLPTKTNLAVTDPVGLQVRTAIELQDEVYVRAADPNDPAPTPTCA
jgi:prepilin-type N-terminal cleavage/methylation domain-containing protein